MDANIARKLVAEHQGRKKIIKELIQQTEESIELACKRGERSTVLHNKKRHWEEIYIEVHEHFTKLGFEIKKYKDSDDYYITW